MSDYNEKENNILKSPPPTSRADEAVDSNDDTTQLSGSTPNFSAVDIYSSNSIKAKHNVLQNEDTIDLNSNNAKHIEKNNNVYRNQYTLPNGEMITSKNTLRSFEENDQ